MSWVVSREKHMIQKAVFMINVTMLKKQMKKEGQNKHAWSGQMHI